MRSCRTSRRKVSVHSPMLISYRVKIAVENFRRGGLKGRTSVRGSGFLGHVKGERQDALFKGRGL